jgi:hypothetical protein
MKPRKIVAFLSNDRNSDANEEWNAHFWEGVSDRQRFQAAWELVELAWVAKGRKLDELRLKRTVGLFKPPPR